MTLLIKGKICLSKNCGTCLLVIESAKAPFENDRVKEYCTITELLGLKAFQRSCQYTFSPYKKTEEENMKSTEEQMIYVK